MPNLVTPDAAHEPDGSQPGRSLQAAAVHWLIRRHRVVLGVMLALIAVSIPIAWQTQMDTSIEPMFSPDDPALVAFRESREIFGGDEFVLVSYDVEDEEALLDRDHLESLKLFADELSAVNGVQGSSTQDLGHLLKPENAGSFGMAFYLRLKSVRQKILEFSEGLLVSPDHKTTAIVLRLTPRDQTDAPRAETISAIRTLAEAHDPPAYVVGEPVQIQDTFEYVQRDARLLGAASSILLMIVIALLFRRLRWVVLPIAIVWATLSMTRATMTLLGMHISMVSSVLTSLVTIIGIATTMHMTVNYREQRLAGLDRPAALKATLLAVGPAVFWSCVTTSIGFLALASSDVVPVREFGLMMALGIAYVLALSLLLLPCGILLGRRSSDPSQGFIDALLAMALRRLGAHLSRHGGKWVLASTVLLLLSGYGLTKLTIETDYTRNFRDDSRIVKALEFFETRMGGSGSWELLLPAPKRYSPAMGDKLRDLRARLGDIEVNVDESPAKLTKIITLADGVDMIPPIVRNRELRSGSSEMLLLDNFQPEFRPSLYQPADGMMRVMLRSKERQPAEAKLELVQRVTHTATEMYPGAKPTGLFILLANLVGSLLRDQAVSFLLAAGGIWLAISIAFRSPVLGVVALVPNLLPIALVLGTIGWANIPMNMGTAMIASVSMGLTVDSAIHYMAAYRRCRELGETPWRAVQLVHADTGRALIFSQLALVGGFSVLALSSFVPLIYFGVLVSVAMFVGLFGVLVVLPVLLVWSDRNSVVSDDAEEPQAVPSLVA